MKQFSKHVKEQKIHLGTLKLASCTEKWKLIEL